MCDFSHCASNQEMITEKATKVILKFEKVGYINVDIFFQHLLNFFYHISLALKEEPRIQRLRDSSCL